MKKYLIIALSIAFLYSCNKSNDTTKGGHHHETKTPLNEQTEAMLAIHDSIMPHMDKLMDLKKQIKNDVKITDSLAGVEINGSTENPKRRSLEITSQLDNTDKAMMNWMHEFKFDTLEKLDKTRGGFLRSRSKEENRKCQRTDE